MFALDKNRYEEPVLVSGTDGVGTKLRLAFMADKHDTIGQDAVAMSVNDVLVQGAEPLFFLDYIAVDKVRAEQVAQIVSGVAKACKESGCALIGGETAEMAGFYADGEYDIAGFCVGIADKKRLITGETIRPGDVLLGLASSGVHSNGFSLVRKICFDRMGFAMDTPIPEFGKTLGEELLTPTRLYPKLVLPLLEKVSVKGMVHITGGGFYDNIPRVLPTGCAVTVDAAAWPMPAVFAQLQKWGQVEWSEMFRTFNMGIGFIMVVDPADEAAVLAHFEALGEPVYRLGDIREGNQDVVMKGGVFGG